MTISKVAKEYGISKSTAKELADSIGKLTLQHVRTEVKSEQDNELRALVIQLVGAKLKASIAISTKLADPLYLHNQGAEALSIFDQANLGDVLRILERMNPKPDASRQKPSAQPNAEG